MTQFLALYIVAGVIAAALAVLVLVLTCLDRRLQAAAAEMRDAPRLEVEPYREQRLLQTGAPIWWLPFWNSN